MTEKNVIVIGAGFSGISAATCLADQGFNVTVLEKNSTPGGRARSFTTQGFTFDMGPSWYWMPEVFEKFFTDFGHSAADFYELQLLDPSFEVIYDRNECLKIPSDYQALRQLFEDLE